jgi:hypothetical protein
MKFRLALSISPSIKLTMPTIVFSPSPVPMPRSASKTPVYSQKLPSQRPLPSYRPHIMPNRKADMIPSYSPSSTPTPLPSASASPAQVHSHSLIIASLQGLGAIGILMLVSMILWAIRGEMNRNRKKQKTRAEFTQSELIIQQINPTAYSKLNLIRRASSNSLNSSGNISPV